MNNAIAAAPHAPVVNIRMVLALPDIVFRNGRPYR